MAMGTLDCVNPSSPPEPPVPRTITDMTRKIGRYIDNDQIFFKRIF